MFLTPLLRFFHFKRLIGDLVWVGNFSILHPLTTFVAAPGSETTNHLAANLKKEASMRIHPLQTQTNPP